MKKKSLIIVESPAKIKTLKKFLGPEFLFESSIGHIRDLPQKDFGIDFNNNFEPQYVVMPDKSDVIDHLIKAAKKVDIVYLSPDPDREGEAIAWHISQILPKDTVMKRVSFTSITKREVLNALEHPREIDAALVDAQQARRILDRIVGYKISPILNRRIQRGKGAAVSAGRVQSVALKLVVDREKEIQAFKPVEYWNLGAYLLLDTDGKSFKANLFTVDGKRVEKEETQEKDIFLIPNKAVADKIVARMKKTGYEVVDVVRKEKKRHPVPPFITSTLQQEASRHAGFSSARTMSIAQTLYEGVDLGNEGQEGLITYMRTDSVRVEPEAIHEARALILQTFGKEYLPESPRFYTAKKAAQDAHEAIRPTNLSHPPEKVKPYLTKEQFMLYQLIWRRFVASQMSSAIYDTVSADIACGEGLILRATGSVLKFAGYLAVYEEKVDEEDKSDEDRLLPDLKAGQNLKVQDIFAEQAFTRPPPRFTEASLVKELEKLGIGRPSTYAAIMNKIQSRDYTVKEAGRLKPTELGEVIALMLENNFHQIMDIGFTARMEDELEMVAEDKKAWRDLIGEFWKDFAPTIEVAEKEAFVPKVLTQLPCPKCQEGHLQKIWYKSKYFYGCSRYPECDYSAQLEELDFNKADFAEDFNWEQPCPLCQKEMKLRHGRFGPFLGCVTYPECKGIVNIPKKGETVEAWEDAPSCVAVGCDGKLQKRKSRFGKTFYSCSNFPDCDVIVNELSQLEEKYQNHPKTAYVKKKKVAAKKAAFTKGKKPVEPKPKTVKAKSTKTSSKTPRQMPTYELSSDLQNLLQLKEATRADVLKGVWAYIKEHDLQGKENKRLICPDAKLAKVLKTKDPVDMMKLSGLLGTHLKK